MRRPPAQSAATGSPGIAASFSAAAAVGGDASSACGASAAAGVPISWSSEGPAGSPFSETAGAACGFRPRAAGSGVDWSSGDGPSSDLKAATAASLVGSRHDARPAALRTAAAWCQTLRQRTQRTERPAGPIAEALTWYEAAQFGQTMCIRES